MSKKSPSFSACQITYHHFQRLRVELLNSFNPANPRDNFLSMSCLLTQIAGMLYRRISDNKEGCLLPSIRAILRRLLFLHAHLYRDKDYSSGHTRRSRRDAYEIGKSRREFRAMITSILDMDFQFDFNFGAFKFWLYQAMYLSDRKKFGNYKNNKETTRLVGLVEFFGVYPGLLKQVGSKILSFYSKNIFIDSQVETLMGFLDNEDQKRVDNDPFHDLSADLDEKELCEKLSAMSCSPKQMTTLLSELIRYFDNRSSKKDARRSEFLSELDSFYHTSSFRSRSKTFKCYLLEKKLTACVKILKRSFFTKKDKLMLAVVDAFNQTFGCPGEESDVERCSKSRHEQLIGEIVELNKDIPSFNAWLRTQRLSESAQQKRRHITTMSDNSTADSTYSSRAVAHGIHKDLSDLVREVAESSFVEDIYFFKSMPRSPYADFFDVTKSYSDRAVPAAWDTFKSCPVDWCPGDISLLKMYRQMNLTKSKVLGSQVETAFSARLKAAIHALVTTQAIRDLLSAEHRFSALYYFCISPQMRYFISLRENLSLARTWVRAFGHDAPAPEKAPMNESDLGSLCDFFRVYKGSRRLVGSILLKFRFPCFDLASGPLVRIHKLEESLCAELDRTQNASCSSVY